VRFDLPVVLVDVNTGYASEDRTRSCSRVCIAAESGAKNHDRLTLAPVFARLFLESLLLLLLTAAAAVGWSALRHRQGVPGTT